MNTDHLITTTQLANATGATYRKVERWARSGVIEPAQHAAGSGHHHLYHPNLIPIVTTLNHISEALHGAATLTVLRLIADRHHTGHLELDHGIRLLWPVDLDDDTVDRLLAAIHDLEHDPNYPDVNPTTGDERETQPDQPDDHATRALEFDRRRFNR